MYSSQKKRMQNELIIKMLICNLTNVYFVRKCIILKNQHNIACNLQNISKAY